jgi:hypothetical protein
MKYLTILIAFLNIPIARLLAPIYMLVLVWFIKWEDTPRSGQGADDLYLTIRGYLPKPLRFAQTIDCPYPGGMYEITVKERLEAHGKLWCSYVWSGWRNPMGISGFFQKPAENPNSLIGVQSGNTLEFSRYSDGYWKVQKNFKNFMIQYGWEIYKVSDSEEYIMIPHLTARIIK